MKDERLERLSDKVRRGVAIDFTEALEVIAYQSKLKQERIEQDKITSRKITLVVAWITFIAAVVWLLDCMRLLPNLLT